MKTWFRASDKKIFNLSKLDCFWCEQRGEAFIVFGGVYPLVYDNVYPMKECKNEQEAKDFIELIYPMLNEEVK